MTVEEQIGRFPFGFAGGVNAWDVADSLVRRSHQSNGLVWGQVSPMESPDALNIDFFQDGWGTRLGSVESDDLRSVLASGDALLDGIEWADPASGTRAIIILGQLSMYTNQSGSFARLTFPNTALTAYSHGSTVTKWSWVTLDGHLLVPTDGSTNRIRVHRSGSAVDDSLGNNTTTTTVDSDSNSGQTVLSVAATTMFQPGDRVRINSGGARDESGYIASISAGASITLMDNLAFTHTAVQADVVQVANRWTEAYDTSTTHVVTGDWELATYIGAAVTDKLTFGKGNSLVEYTPSARTASSGIWNLAGTTAGFYGARANIVGVASFVPDQGDLNQQIAYVFTSQGPGILTGFEDYDQGMDQNRQAGGVPLNNRCIVSAKTWLVYMTTNKDIEAINGKTVINLGRRLKTLAKTGPLDDISVSESALTAFGFYDAERERVIFHATTSSGRVNDVAFIVDFRLGEPLLGEGRDSYEKHVSVMPWSIVSPDTNDWFYGMFQRLGQVSGVMADGRLYTVGGETLPRTDLGTLAVDNYWETPWFNGGSDLLKKLIMNLIARFKKSGNWSASIDVYVDYGNNSVKQVTIPLIEDGDAVYGVAQYGVDVYTGEGVIMRLREIDRNVQAFKLRISTSTISQYWQMVSGLTEYQPGAMEI